MQNVATIVRDGLCLGCAACFSACPYGCIAFADGPNSFPVPTVSGCRDCGQCLAACPIAADEAEG